MFRITALALILSASLGAASKPKPTAVPTAMVYAVTSVSVTAVVVPTPIVAYNATVKNVVDGDTFDVVIDVWTNTELKVRVRLYGVDTPELKAKDAKKKALALRARAFLETTILERPVLVMRVDQDSFGRTLAKVLFEKNGQWVDLGDELVKTGLAIKGYDHQRF